MMPYWLRKLTVVGIYKQEMYTQVDLAALERRLQKYIDEKFVQLQRQIDERFEELKKMVLDERT